MFTASVVYIVPAPLTQQVPDQPALPNETSLTKESHSFLGALHTRTLSLSCLCPVSCVQRARLPKPFVSRHDLTLPGLPLSDSRTGCPQHFPRLLCQMRKACTLFRQQAESCGLHFLKKLEAKCRNLSKLK